MKLFAIFFIAFVGCTNAKNIKRSDFEYEHGSVGGNTGYSSDLGLGSHLSQTSNGNGKGYSAGSGLRTIAQGSAHQANSAVANQDAAGKQAAYVAKSTLAQAAIQAAATAQAALVGKEVLLQGLEAQSAEAHHVLEGEIAQLQLAKTAAKSAQQAAQQAINHVSVLTAALNSAQGVAEHAEQTANGAAAELASQTAMVGKAKARLEAIEKYLQSAQIDFEATQEAAAKASSSAQEAQNNASQAAVHATVELHGSAAKQISSSATIFEDSGHNNDAEVANNHQYHY